MPNRHPAHLTHAEATNLDEEDTVTQVVVHPAMLPALVEWLDRRGIDLVPYAVDGAGEELSTYIASPRLG